ncbi:MAG: hypothetical protein ABSE51_11370 [Terracidiphilus sp.]|jgi:hypothetical protein
MRIYSLGFGRFAKPILRPVLVGTVASFLFAQVEPVQQESECPVAMKNDIQQLKAQHPQNKVRSCL